MKVRITHLDGKLANLALMRISAYHKSRGDEVTFRRTFEPDLLEPEYDLVYGSAIFKFSDKRVARFQAAFPQAILGGTGTFSTVQVEDICPGPEKYDYEIYPDFDGSLGFTQRGCRLSCKFCLTPGNLVITGDGLKPIENVQIGDMVLTHLGQYRRVVKLICRWYVGDVVRLNAGTISELFPTEVTDNHKIWTRHISCYGNKHPTPGQRLTLFNWVESIDLEAKQFPKAREVFAYPRVKTVRDINAVPGASDWEQYDYGGARQRVITDLLVDDDFMELVGFYLAEGHVSAGRNGRLYSTIFSFGHSDTERMYALRVSETLRSYGLDPAVSPVPTGTRVTAYSSRFAQWINSQFGVGSATKRIPLWVRLLPTNRIRQLLQAWCEGDGWYHVKRGARTWKITTVSRDLAVSCRELALKCGYSTTINKHHAGEVIQGRKVNSKPAFTVIFHEPAFMRNSTTHDANYVYHAINESSVRSYAGYVYNLEVEETHSYCTPAFCVINCVVPEKEGKPRSVNSIYDIWRGPPHPKHIHLLDNDFFGQDLWRERVKEIIEGGFKVCFNQGINTRLITEESAAALATLPYYDDQFKVRRLYTAWDNLKDFKIFMRGVDLLQAAGVDPKNLLAYMLIGFAKNETMEEIQWRFERMKERGIFAFPMVFDRSRPELRAFARWAIRGIHNVCGFDEYRTSIRKKNEREGDFFAEEAAE